MSLPLCPKSRSASGAAGQHVVAVAAEQFGGRQCAVGSHPARARRCRRDRTPDAGRVGHRRVPPVTAIAPPLTRIAPAALRLMVIVLSAASAAHRQDAAGKAGGRCGAGRCRCGEHDAAAEDRRRQQGRGRAPPAVVVLLHVENLRSICRCTGRAVGLSWRYGGSGQTVLCCQGMAGLPFPVGRAGRFRPPWHWPRVRAGRREGRPCGWYRSASGTAADPGCSRRCLLEIGPGRSVAIGGANGSGKSTLLNLLAGLIRPTVGTISPPPRCIGYVPERFPATSRMSTTAYLTHLARIRGLSTVSGQTNRRGVIGSSPVHWRARFRPADPVEGKCAEGRAGPGDARAARAADSRRTLDRIGCGGVRGSRRDHHGSQRSGARWSCSALIPECPPQPCRRLGICWRRERSLPVPEVAGPAVGAGQSKRVLIRRTDGSAELPTARSVRCSASGIDRAVLICTVPVADCDRFLLDCLRRGWSVVQVGPVETPRPDDRSDPAGGNSTEPGASS